MTLCDGDAAGPVAALDFAGQKCAAVSNPKKGQPGVLHVFDLDTEAQAVSHKQSVTLSDEVGSVCWLDSSYLVPSLAVGLLTQ